MDACLHFQRSKSEEDSNRSNWNFALTDCPSYCTLNTQITGPLVSFAFRKHQTRVSLSFEVISSAQPWFGSGPFPMGGGCDTTRLPSPFGETRITGSILLRYPLQSQSLGPNKTVNSYPYRNKMFTPTDYE